MIAVITVLSGGCAVLSSSGSGLRDIGYFGPEQAGQEAAKKIFRKSLKGLRYVPSVIVTDKLRSYSAERTEVMPSVEHVQQKYQNTRHLTLRQLKLTIPS
jgi:hypothetical protein